MPDTRRQCRHIHAQGRRCGSPCLNNEPFCFHHHTDRRRPNAAAFPHEGRADFPMPPIDDRAAIQGALYEVLCRIASNGIDEKRARLLLFGLQIASSNLPRPGVADPTPPPEPTADIIFDDNLGYLAPETTLETQPPIRKSLTQLLRDEQDEKTEQAEQAEPPRKQSQPSNRVPHGRDSPTVPDMGLLPRETHGRPRRSSPCPERGSFCHPERSEGPASLPQPSPDPYCPAASTDAAIFPCTTTPSNNVAAIR